jgi:hypothetical protein
MMRILPAIFFIGAGTMHLVIPMRSDASPEIAFRILPNADKLT